MSENIQKYQTIDYMVIAEDEESLPYNLNAFHTHQIFVDDGLRNEKAENAAANFRADLEKMIGEPVHGSDIWNLELSAG